VQNQRNLVLAIVLSAIVLIGWSLLAPRFAPPVANPPATKIVNGKQVALPTPETAREAKPIVRDRAAALKESPRIAIATPKLVGTLNLKGARIDDLVLTDHRETVAKDSPPVRLLSPGGTPDAYFAGFGWMGDNVALPGADTIWTADGTTLTPETPVTLTWDNGQGQRFALKFAVDKSYMFTVTQTVQNSAAAPVTLRSYGLISRTGMSKDLSSWTMHTGPIGKFDNGANYDVSFENLDGQEPGFFARVTGTSARAGTNDFTTSGGWLGFGDKYWQTALVPAAGTPTQARFLSSGEHRYQADFAGQPQAIPAGKAWSTQNRFFAGAKEVSVLDAYEAQGVPLFDRAIDWGWFVWFEKPIFYLLDKLFHLVGNFGVAIILLTCIVRAILFPVAQRQFSSMAKMRVLQPKMKALQERYKDDKPRLQTEMMELYKSEKANPLAGCLPIFVQMPIFIALYKVLSLSIEMRHQPFALWIRDLSAPDPLTPINLFGYLPFQPPGMLHLGVLAILLGITMWLQMKMNPAVGDPAQQQVMAIMPWMMMLFFAPLAAGLQLYYVMNNLLTLGQQRILYARTPGMRDPVS